MTQIISDIRIVMTQGNVTQMNIQEIINRLVRSNPARYNTKAGYTKDNIQETLNHYKKLSVVFIDNE